MKPIEAQVCYKKKVKENGENKLDNGNQVYEDIIADGIFADVMIMRDEKDGKEADGAYALFFEDKETYFTPSVEMLGDIRVSPRKMREYVSIHYTK